MSTVMISTPPKHKVSGALPCYELISGLMRAAVQGTIAYTQTAAASITQPLHIPCRQGFSQTQVAGPQNFLTHSPGTNFGAAKLTQASQPALASTDCAQPCH